MKILKIEVLRECIRLYTDADGRVYVRVSVPTVGVKPGRMLAMTAAEAVNGVIELPRTADGHDCIRAHFTVYTDGEPAEGVCYVTDIADEVPENVSGYPQVKRIKTLSGTKKICDELEIEQGLTNVNLPAMMTLLPAPDDLPYVYDGRTYYFRRAAVEDLDATVMSHPMITMILLNSPRLFGSAAEKPLLDACIHPGFDWDWPMAFISAFDMQTEEGQGFFGAFTEFLAQRYTRPDQKYGHLVGFIVSNEVSSQYVWGNAGEMPAEQYAHEYTEALRLAWLNGRKHCSHFRVYISLDQYWCNTRHDPSQPLRFYPGRTLVELLNQYATAEGNFGWGVANHPYPEDLSHPDFWNDRTPNFTFSTPKLTFRNMEVLEAFLSQEAYLYRGEPRRIIYSEQGFNSSSDALQALTEKQAAAGYVLAYMKARKMKTVGMLTHHAFVDNPKEFGLNLGIFRYDPNAEDHVGEPKPIYESVKAMDTPAEAEAVRKAREFIGEELFDYLLNPPLVYGERDASKDAQFGA